MDTQFVIRKATAADIPALNALIAESVRGLQAEDYTEAQMEGALKTVFGVDSQLVADGTYLVVEAVPAAEPHRPGDPTPSGVIVGCGGWSMRKTLFGGDVWSARQDDFLDPAREASKIRAFFIHPAWARRGIGSMLLDACETAARATGFQRYEMGATLTGAKLFAAKGYIAMKRIEIPLVNGEKLPVIHMEKSAAD
jgi:N-acetylglutamate synthase-like GNAT family acetyltransferase